MCRCKDDQIFRDLSLIKKNNTSDYCYQPSNYFAIIKKQRLYLNANLTNLFWKEFTRRGK